MKKWILIKMKKQLLFLLNRKNVMLLIFICITAFPIVIKAQDILIAEYKFETDAEGWIFQSYTNIGGTTTSPTGGWISGVNWSPTGGTAGCIRHNFGSAAGSWFARSPGITLTEGKEYYIKFGSRLAGFTASTNQRVQARVGTSTTPNGGTIILPSVSFTSTNWSSYVEFTSNLYTAPTTGTYYFAVADFYSNGSGFACYFDGIRIYEVFSGGPTIETQSISGSPFCAGSTVDVPFTITSSFNSGNVFTAQLSDASGSFNNPVSIGTLASENDGTINTTIPIATSGGSGYRIRVVGSSPATTGEDNGSNLTIVAPSTRYRTVDSGNWNSVDIWEYSIGCETTYDPAVQFPDENNSNEILIRNGHIVTLTDDVSIKQLSIDNTTGSLLQINENVTLTLQSGTNNNITLQANSSVIVNGTLVNYADIHGSSVNNLQFATNGKYEHARNGGNIPTATWNASSTLLVSGMTNTTPSNFAQSFGNITWNCPAQSTNASLLNTNNPVNVSGTFLIENTNGTNIIDFSGIDRVWNGDLVITGGRVALLRGSTVFISTLTVHNFTINDSNNTNTRLFLNNNSSNFESTFGILKVTGNIVINPSTNISGIITLTSIASAPIQTGSLLAEGNFTISNGSLIGAGGVASSNIKYIGSSVKHWIQTGGSISNVLVTVNSGAVLDMQEQVISNSGGFMLESGATLIIGSIDGISLTGSSGNIQSTGTRTFHSSANYIYNGQTSQVTGTGLTGAGILEINNANNISLSVPVHVQNSLSLTNGSLVLGSNNLILGASATVAGTTSVTNMLIADGTGRFVWTIPETDEEMTFLFPIGDATPNYTPVQLIFSSNETQGTVGVNVTNATAPENNNPSAPIVYLSRYWSFSQSGLTNYNYKGSFAYPTANVNPLVNEPQMWLSAWTGSEWKELQSSATAGVLTLASFQSNVIAPLSGVFTGRTQYSDYNVSWTGSNSTDWNTAGNWSPAIVPGSNHNVSIPLTANMPVINESKLSPAVCNNIEIASGVTLRIEPNKALTVFGNIIHNGIMLLESSSIGDASLIIEGAVSGGGTYNVERYFTGNAWHSVSPSVQNATAAVFMNIWLREYHENTNTWGSFVTSIGTPLVVGKGYNVWSYQAEETRTYHGVINHGTIQMPPVSMTGTPGIGQGWNLVGNPYPSAINWKESAGWTKNNIAPTVYIWNPAVGQYAVYNANTNIATNGGSRFIASGQGFFVQATNNAASLQINNNARTHSEVIFKSDEHIADTYLNISVKGDRFSDENIIIVRNDATNEYDFNYDAIKMKGVSEAPQLYTLKQNEALAVHAVSNIEDMSGKVIHFEPGTSNSFELMFTINNNAQNISIIDRLTGKHILPNQRYSFVASTNENTARFEIALNAENAVNHISANDDILVWVNDKILYVDNIHKNSDLDIIVLDILGKIVKRSNTKITSLHGLSSGVYLIQVTDALQTVTRKHFVQ